MTRLFGIRAGGIKICGFDQRAAEKCLDKRDYHRQTVLSPGDHIRKVQLTSVATADSAIAVATENTFPRNLNAINGRCFFVGTAVGYPLVIFAAVDTSIVG